MALVRFDPYSTFNLMSKKINDFMGEVEKGVTVDYGSFAPRVDIAEDEKALYIHAELPGIKKEDVKVSVNNDNVLIIKGEKKRDSKFEEKAEDKCFLRVERSFGTFTRSFMLPDNVKTDSINAKYDNGVLNITLDKVEPQKPKEVTVEIQ
jgi:HSP20 family protein